MMISGRDGPDPGNSHTINPISQPANAANSTP